MSVHKKSQCMMKNLVVWVSNRFTLVPGTFPKPSTTVLLCTTSSTSDTEPLLPLSPPMREHIVFSWDCVRLL